MGPRTWLLAGLGYAAAAYAWDVLLTPAREARRARAEADSLGKPLLNVGAGTPDSSFRAKVFGPQLIGDVNLDLAADPRTPHGSNQVSYGDVQNLPFGDKTFGVAYTSHVLEHTNDPARALAELHRVADEVRNVTPAWWAPHTWLHGEHQWYFGLNGSIVPLWRRRRATSSGRVFSGLETAQARAWERRRRIALRVLARPDCEALIRTMERA